MLASEAPGVRLGPLRPWSRSRAYGAVAATIQIGNVLGSHNGDCRWSACWYGFQPRGVRSVRKAIEEIHRGEEHYDDDRQPAGKLGPDRRHALGCHHAHDDDTHRRHQRFGRKWEVMPFTHQLDGALTREHQHREDAYATAVTTSAEHRAPRSRPRRTVSRLSAGESFTRYRDGSAAGTNDARQDQRSPQSRMIVRQFQNASVQFGYGGHETES
jgi:hypothetical protein